MKKNFETTANQAAFARRRRIGVVSLLLVLVFAAMAGGRTISGIADGAKDTCSLVASYWRSGEWRAEGGDLVAQFEYVFLPNSGACARIDLDLDE